MPILVPEARGKKKIPVYSLMMSRLSHITSKTNPKHFAMIYPKKCSVLVAKFLRNSIEWLKNFTTFAIRFEEQNFHKSIYLINCNNA